MVNDDAGVKLLKQYLDEGQQLCGKISTVATGHTVVGICFALYGFLEALGRDPAMAEAIRVSRKAWDDLGTQDHN